MRAILSRHKGSFRSASLNNVGATEWTVGKLVSIILVVFLIVLVTIGITTGALTPLKDRLSGWFDNVLSYFGWGEQTVTNGQIRVEVPGVGYGNMSLTGKECKIDMDGGKGSYALNANDFSKFYSYETYYKVTMPPGSGHSEQILYFKYSDVFNYWQWSARKVYWAFVDVNNYNNGGSDIYTANTRFQNEYLSYLKGKDRVAGEGFFNGKISSQGNDKNNVEMFKDLVSINQVIDGSLKKEQEAKQWKLDLFNDLKSIRKSYPSSGNWVEKKTADNEWYAVSSNPDEGEDWLYYGASSGSYSKLTGLSDLFLYDSGFRVKYPDAEKVNQLKLIKDFLDKKCR